MSHFPCIRPSLLNKKWIIQETKLNRIEIVRRKEEALLQKFKLISKQDDYMNGEQNTLNQEHSQDSESDSAMSNSINQADLPDMEMTDGDFDSTEEF